jgi:hypothetical protein
MDVAELLTEAYGRIRGIVHHVVDGLSEEQLAARLDPEANSIAWLVWHLARVQDDHVADVADEEQVYGAQHFDERFGFPFDTGQIGYGMSSEDVGLVRASGPLLAEYYDAVHEATLRFVRTLSPGKLSHVVDPSFDPPVTLGVRLVSVLSDDLQHAGQAAYVRGIVERRRLG